MALVWMMFVCVGVSIVQADSPLRTTELLWPNGAPGAPQGSDAEEGDVPQLIFTKAKSERPTAAIVILPGGGYQTHAMDHEGYQFADWFESLGISSAICTYRHRGKGNRGEGYGHPYPMLDAQRAIQTLRARSQEWNIDPNRIGVIGFSAGGHLCSTVSTHFAETDPDSPDPIARVSSRPDFAILCYPVIVFEKGHTHRGSQRNLLGPDPDPQLVESLSNERQVTDRTPPTFLFHTAQDQAVPAQNSLDYYLACLQNGVEAELHVFPEGPHGVGLARNQAGAKQWPGLCRDWLKRNGIAVKD
jgi:acetyl esterase/lipase